MTPTDRRLACKSHRWDRVGCARRASSEPHTSVENAPLRLVLPQHAQHPSSPAKGPQKAARGPLIAAGPYLPTEPRRTR